MTAVSFWATYSGSGAGPGCGGVGFKLGLAEGLLLGALDGLEVGVGLELGLAEGLLRGGLDGLEVGRHAGVSCRFATGIQPFFSQTPL